MRYLRNNSAQNDKTQDVCLYRSVSSAGDPLPHKARLRWERRQLNRNSSKINTRFLSAAVSDTQEIPLTDQIPRRLS